MTFLETLSKLPQYDQIRINAVMALFNDLESQTTEFANRNGLACVQGCGHCCENPLIETTLTEMLPLALELWSDGQAGEVLERIEKNEAGRCVFFSPHPNVPGNGRCLVYAFRPGVCRLFGFSAKRDKHGRNILATCKIIKANQPAQCTATQDALDAHAPAPCINDATMKVYAIDPTYGRELLPINQAVAKAIEQLGLKLKRD